MAPSFYINVVVTIQASDDLQKMQNGSVSYKELIPVISSVTRVAPPERIRLLSVVRISTPFAPGMHLHRNAFRARFGPALGDAAIRSKRQTMGHLLTCIGHHRGRMQIFDRHDYYSQQAMKKTQKNRQIFIENTNI